MNQLIYLMDARADARDREQQTRLALTQRARLDARPSTVHRGPAPPGRHRLDGRLAVSRPG